MNAQMTKSTSFFDESGVLRTQVPEMLSRIAFVKLYDRKNALVAADLFNDPVIPFFEHHDIKLLRVLTDRGTDYCGRCENHEYQLYLAAENIDHSKTKVKSLQQNGIVEGFQKTVPNEF